MVQSDRRLRAGKRLSPFSPPPRGAGRRAPEAGREKSPPAVGRVSGSRDL